MSWLREIREALASLSQDLDGLVTAEEDETRKDQLATHKSNVDNTIQNLDSVNTDVVNLEQNVTRLRESLFSGSTGAPTHDDKWRLYAEIGNYDRHYSTVRTGVNTFLGGLGVTVGSIGVIEHSEPWSIIIAGVFFLFALVFNARFYVMTRTCWEMQKAIEQGSVDELPSIGGVRRWAKMSTARLKEFNPVWFGIVAFFSVFGVLLVLLQGPLRGMLPTTAWFGIYFAVLVFVFGFAAFKKWPTPERRSGIGPVGFFTGPPDFHFCAALTGFSLVLWLLITYCASFNEECECRMRSHLGASKLICDSPNEIPDGRPAVDDRLMAIEDKLDEFRASHDSFSSHATGRLEIVIEVLGDQIPTPGAEGSDNLTTVMSELREILSRIDGLELTPPPPRPTGPSDTELRNLRNQIQAIAGEFSGATAAVRNLSGIVGENSPVLTTIRLLRDDIDAGREKAEELIRALDGVVTR
ncbi:MAG: hypothetical protein RIC16_16060 [Rhodospirillales bacterium]